jgi:hypothetical protein
VRRGKKLFRSETQDQGEKYGAWLGDTDGVVDGGTGSSVRTYFVWVDAS